jgi:hypothetical protein
MAPLQIPSSSVSMRLLSSVAFTGAASTASSETEMFAESLFAIPRRTSEKTPHLIEDGGALPLDEFQPTSSPN